MSNFDSIEKNIEKVDAISSDKKITKKELYELQKILEKENILKNDEKQEIYNNTIGNIKDFFQEKLIEMFEKGIYIENEIEYNKFQNMLSKTNLKGKYIFPEFSRVGYINLESNKDFKKEKLYFSKLKTGGFVITLKKEKFIEINKNNFKRELDLTKKDFNNISSEKTNFLRDYNEDINIIDLKNKSQEIKNLKNQLVSIKNTFEKKIKQKENEKKEILVYMYSVRDNLETNIKELENKLKDQQIKINILNGLLKKSKQNQKDFIKNNNLIFFGEKIDDNYDIIDGESIGFDKQKNKKIHIVSKGENLWTIVKNHYKISNPGQIKKKIQEIISNQDNGKMKNRLIKTKGSNIWVGDKIKLI